jgi:dihydrofolate reductase
MDLTIIAAVANNGIIGSNGEIPWNYSEDLRHFKETTLGHPVIMGRKTFESIKEQVGGPLSDRINIVLSRESPNLPESVLLASSIEEALQKARMYTGECEPAFIIGGAEIYRQFLPHADRLLITKIPDEYNGDTYFPDYNNEDWKIIERNKVGDITIVEYSSVVK